MEPRINQLFGQQESDTASLIESDFIPYLPTTTLPEGNVLVLAPHPDDELFGCGGAIMQHLAQHHAVHVVVVTDGYAAKAHPDEAHKQAYVELRRQESIDAARFVGYPDPIFWDVPDRGLMFEESRVMQVLELLETLDIQRMYAPSSLEIHPDHYALALIAEEAATRYEKSLDVALYEVGIPLNPNLLLDITAFEQKKFDALGCFPSQLELNDYRKYVQGLNRFRAFTLTPQVMAAEAYYVVTNAELRQNPLARYNLTRQSRLLTAAQRALS